MLSVVSLGVIKSIMGELTDPSNRAEGFALMPVVWGFGATMGFVFKTRRESFPSLIYIMQTISRRISFSSS
jgi:hypothetical protein